MNDAKHSVELQYFALLREQRGVARETIETSARTLRELYTELAALHHFSLPPEKVGVAVNDAFRSMDATLASGDRIVFLPPVAGG